MQIEFISNDGTSQHLWMEHYLRVAIEFLTTKGVTISTSGSSGGYFSKWESSSLSSPRMQYLVKCGNFPEEKTRGYYYNSQEKAVRLNSKIPKGDTTSRQSQNAEEGEWAGAIYIKINGKIYSFSGLETQWDEFLSVLGSVFDDLLNTPRNNHERLVLRDVPDLFKSRMYLITATNDEKDIMLDVVEATIQLEFTEER